MPVLGPMPQGDAQLQLGTKHGEMEAAIDVFPPGGIAAAASPEVEIALLVAGPPMALPLFQAQAVGIDLGVSDLFVDEWHGWIA